MFRRDWELAGHGCRRRPPDGSRGRPQRLARPPTCRSPHVGVGIRAANQRQVRRPCRLEVSVYRPCPVTSATSSIRRRGEPIGPGAEEFTGRQGNGWVSPSIRRAGSVEKPILERRVPRRLPLRPDCQVMIGPDVHHRRLPHPDGEDRWPACAGQTGRPGSARHPQARQRNPTLDPEAIEDVVWGAANQAGEDNRNVARMAVRSPLPTPSPAPRSTGCAGRACRRWSRRGKRSLVAGAMSWWRAARSR